MKIFASVARISAQKNRTRRAFLRPLSTQRSALCLEQLETRAVFNADPALGATLGPTCPSVPANHVDVVFAPGTPAEVVAAYDDLENQGGFDLFTFSDTDRWSRTASNGSGLTQGDSTTIRWSIATDGTPIAGYNGEPAAPSNLRSFLAGIYGTNASSSLPQDQPWFAPVQSVFDRWSAVSGVNYVYEPADDGAALGSSFNGTVGIRGDVRLSGHYIDGPSNILAYNFYPTVGDMVLDTGDTFFSNTGTNSLRLRNTMAHEAGHGLGLGHVTPVNGTKLMEPNISLAYDGPQADDILAVNRGYGDRLEKNGGNNTAATASSLGTGATFTIDTVSIDDDSDVDWFQFTVGTGSSISATLTPTGNSYTSNSTTFDAAAQSDLTLAVYGSGGNTLIASANLTGAGVAESLSSLALPGSGTYYVRVTGTANAAQMYRLTGSISNVVVPLAPEIAVLDGTTNIVDGSGSISLGSVNVGGVSTKTFTIQNLGNANLTLGSPTLPTGFILTQAPPLTTLIPGDSTTFIVSLDSSLAGNFGGPVSFTNNDADENPFDFSVSGTVVIVTPTAPEIGVYNGVADIVDGTGSLNFGSVNVGGTSTKTITVRNLGNGDLLIGSINLPAGFTLAQAPGVTTLTPGLSTTFVIALNSATAGTFSGEVSFANNDADENPYNFSVSGSVTAAPTAPEISVLDGTIDIVDNTGSVSFASVVVGGVSSKMFTIRNTGTADLLLQNIVFPNPAYTLTAGPGLTVIPPGASTTLTVSLSSATAGTFGGMLSLGNNDADEGPFNFTISGTVTAAPPTPLTLFTDNFNRSSSSSLGSNWLERSGNFSISANTLVNSTSGTSVALVNNVTTADVILSADVNLGSGNLARDTGLVARHNNTGSGSGYWGGLAYSSGKYYAQIWESTNGSWTRLSATQISSTGNALLRFEVIGSSLKLFVNNVLRTSVTDTTLTSGFVGVSGNNTGPRLDNFSASNPAPLTAPATFGAGSAAAPAPMSLQWLAALDHLLAKWNKEAGDNGQ